MTDQEIERFNKLCNTATRRLKGSLIIGSHKPNKPGFFEKIKIKKSIRDFKICLSMFPEHWQSIFFLAKAYQRLGAHQTSLELFEKAMKIEPDNHNIPQEASLESIQLNNIDKAIEYSTEAIRRSPDNYALMGNHAMNLLIISKDDEAQRMIREALSLSPHDKVNKNIQNIIEQVIAGNKKRPTCKSVAW